MELKEAMQEASRRTRMERMSSFSFRTCAEFWVLHYGDPSDPKESVGSYQEVYRWMLTERVRETLRLYRPELTESQRINASDHAFEIPRKLYPKLIEAALAYLEAN